MLSRPERQKAHSPQGRTAGTTTGIPVSSPESPVSGPRAVTRPAISWPRVRGRGFRVRTPP